MCPYRLFYKDKTKSTTQFTNFSYVKLNNVPPLNNFNSFEQVEL